jgi:hypothetical protein
MKFVLLETCAVKPTITDEQSKHSGAVEQHLLANKMSILVLSNNMYWGAK